MGAFAGPVPNFDTGTLFSRRLRIGEMATSATIHRKKPERHGRNSCRCWRNRGTRPQVDRVFPFEQLPEAFERLRGGPMGKVLMRVKP